MKVGPYHGKSLGFANVLDILNKDMNVPVIRIFPGELNIVIPFVVRVEETDILLSEFLLGWALRVDRS